MWEDWGLRHALEECIDYREPAGVGPEGSDASACGMGARMRRKVVDSARFALASLFMFCMLSLCFYAGLDDPSEDSCVRLAQTRPVQVPVVLVQ